jgi:hypothetical protein
MQDNFFSLPGASLWLPDRVVLGRTRTEVGPKQLLLDRGRGSYAKQSADDSLNRLPPATGKRPRPANILRFPYGEQMAFHLAPSVLGGNAVSARSEFRFLAAVV